MASPTLSHSAFFLGSSAGKLLLPGRVMPRVSIADAMVLAVYIPPHAPPPGQALRIMSWRSFSSIWPVMYWP